MRKRGDTLANLKALCYNEQERGKRTVKNKPNQTHRSVRLLSLLLTLSLVLSLLAGCTGGTGNTPQTEQSAVTSAQSSEPEQSTPAPEESLPEAEESVSAAPAEASAPEESAPEESAPEAEQEEEIYTITGEDGYTLSNDASDFVLLSDAVPDAILEIRYYSTYNFIGERIDGYEQPVALLTKEAAAALKEVSDDLVERGYRLKIFDAYRPQSAVSHFVRWAEDLDDTRMKPYFYPELDKSVLFEQGYIAAHSGHSRGSTVDLTLFDMETEREVDMGGTFDYFGELSHPDYEEVTTRQYKKRMLLREVMTKHGFRPLSEEWWHFTLENEPYPDTYFTFPVHENSVK